MDAPSRSESAGQSAADLAPAVSVSQGAKMTRDELGNILADTQRKARWAAAVYNLRVPRLRIDLLTPRAGLLVEEAWEHRCPVVRGTPRASVDPSDITGYFVVHPKKRNGIAVASWEEVIERTETHLDYMWQDFVDPWERMRDSTEACWTYEAMMRAALGGDRDGLYTNDDAASVLSGQDLEAYLSAVESGPMEYRRKMERESLLAGSATDVGALATAVLLQLGLRPRTSDLDWNMLGRAIDAEFAAACASVADTPSRAQGWRDRLCSTLGRKITNWGTGAGTSMTGAANTVSRLLSKDPRLQTDDGRAYREPTVVLSYLLDSLEDVSEDVSEDARLQNDEVEAYREAAVVLGDLNGL
ncbi:hypothetical protein Q5752_001101 [Cryptotrichosporon argae]